MEDSMAKMILVTLLLIGAMATASGSDSFTKCGKKLKFYKPRDDLFFRNVDLVLSELKAKTPVDGNFEHETETKSPKVFGRASCFSSLTSSAETCTACLEKAIKDIKKKCNKSVRASGGSAAAGCSIHYDNIKIKN